MAEAYIVEAVRTAGGRRNGRLAGWHPNDLGGAVLSAAVQRSGIDPAAVDDVIMGCVSQAGEQGLHIGRNCVLASILPESVPAVSIDRQCGSSQQAIHFAAQAVMSGTQDVVIAAGVESMSRVPMGTTALPGTGARPFSQTVLDRFGTSGFSQFQGAEMMAKKHGFAREQLDAYALETHRRAAAATERGDFVDEIVPLEVELSTGREQHEVDEGIRFDASIEGLATLKTLVEGGTITAGNASQVCDGASAVMIVSGDALKAHGLMPLARVVNLTVTAGDPVIMLEEPLFATDRALARAGLSIGDIDLYEVNEAFAPVPMAWLNHVGADPAKLNVNGGAIALGHPLGASGTKLMATLLHALRKRGGRYGLQTMCEGGGIANVTIIEAL
jgi:acetyl-CoA C-acetyltransferase